MSEWIRIHGNRRELTYAHVTVWQAESIDCVGVRVGNCTMMELASAGAINRLLDMVTAGIPTMTNADAAWLAGDSE